MQNIFTSPSLGSGANRNTLIQISHINIRQSISFVLLKLVVLETIAATGVIIFHTLIISTNIADVAKNTLGSFNIFNVPLFIFLVFLKTALVLYVIILWLNEYYEITPTKLIRKRGVLFKKVDEYVFTHLMSIDMKQSIWGKLFNYGSIYMYDRYINKTI